MKKILLFSFVLLGFSLFSQKNEAISNWIQKNQDVVFIESENLANFSEFEIKKLSNRFIVFNSEIKESDILDFEKKNGIFHESVTEHQTVTVEKESTNPKIQVLNWLNANSEIKIVTQSEFQSADSFAKEEYISKKCMILSGESITIEDIKNYNF